MIVASDVLVVGAGQAAAQLAISLRQAGYAGSVCVLGEEPIPPYERPPLSKDYLAGLREPERLWLRPTRFWVERNVEFALGDPVVHLDLAAREVWTASGTRHGYGKLVWATGGAARRLSCQGGDLDGVHAVRTRADVDLLRRDLTEAADTVIVGGGYIGLEAAAVLRQAGKRVTVLEAQGRVLARVAGERLSRFYEKEHRTRGVTVTTDSSVVSVLAGCKGRVGGVALADGTELPADVVIAGIGIVPATAVAEAAGLDVSDGVVVDEFCRASAAGVFAIGDCANHPNVYAGRRLRLESVQNAVDQAKVVASVILDAPAPYRSVPWFWSHQYDLKLQTVGISSSHDETLVRGDPESRSWSLIYLRRGSVVALDCVNSTRDYVQGRALVEEGAGLERALAVDCDVELRDPSVRAVPQISEDVA